MKPSAFIWVFVLYQKREWRQLLVEGGVNKAGIGDASFWISSNPPPYGVGLAEEFLPGGRFTKS